MVNHFSGKNSLIITAALVLSMATILVWADDPLDFGMCHRSRSHGH